MKAQVKEERKDYWAFISYSSKDRRWGEWLHRRLENYPIPADFRGLEVFDGAILGKNLRPVFRDRDELASSADLGEAIRKALDASRFLVVLCSKNAAKSKWVNKEIEDFQALGKGERILALILDGEPNATDQGCPEDECFPPALRYPAEPIAGDLHKEGDGKARGFLKILAGIAQLDFDKLYLCQTAHDLLDRRKELDANAPLLWIGRECVNDQWRACVTPLFARISEAAFAIIRNGANPSQWLVRRNRHRGNYNLIGGHLETMDGNDGLALIRREIGEELGLHMKGSELRTLTTAPVHALEYSDRSRCMTLYIAHFFEATLSPDRFDEAACQANHCRWIPAAHVLTPADGEPTDIARFPARFLSATADGEPELKNLFAPTGLYTRNCEEFLGMPVGRGSEQHVQPANTNT